MQMLLYYVVNAHGEYEVWEMTAADMYERTLDDPTLDGRLYHHPFATRLEAERCIKKLTANLTGSDSAADSG